jgi:hypothetical protein
MLIKLSTGVSLYGSLSCEGEGKWKEKALARKRVSGKKVKRASGWWNLKKGESQLPTDGITRKPQGCAQHSTSGNISREIIISA